MNRPTMNKEKVARCLKTGKSRAECVKESYPERAGKKGKSKKSGSKPPRGGRY